ncbi:hypothetical protein K435DRAFT_810063 [Dendrothele bispora CBS 962.96]|uniref:Uncharacterized protein n=1 Tax=Dendrothele bispora (strain CBS 962.96) TaxID=1314807 RepID=A0A4S8KW56_DENBC|nr:hypothetical protein K435DRAFT_810063 [Dendrothele bispora CBS 962.96]
MRNKYLTCKSNYFILVTCVGSVGNKYLDLSTCLQVLVTKWTCILPDLSTVDSELHGYTVGTFELTRTRTREKPNPCGGYGYFHGSTKLAYGSRSWRFTGTGWLGSGFLYPDPYPPDPYPQPVATRETRAVH